MKRLISILLILCMLSVLLVSCSSNDSTDDEKQQTIGAQYSKGLAFEPCKDDPSACIITGIGSCTDKSIVIPSSINGMRVVGIKDGAFSPKAQSVAKGVKVGEFIAEEVTDSMLDGVVTDSNVNNEQSTDGTIIFDNFQTVVSPNFNGGALQGGNAENYETGNGIPIDLEKIESVQIPSSVKEIGDEAFYGCEDLNNISTHAALSAIGKDAFKETAYYNNPRNWENGQVLYLSNYLLSVSSDYTGEFTVKEGTTMIADQAFYKCEYITTINTSASLTTVGNYAFYGCTSLTNVQFVSYTATYTFGTGAFDGCISYQPIFPGQNGETPLPNLPTVPDTNGGENEVEDKYPQNYEEIDEKTFERIKKSLSKHYTAETTYSGKNDVEILKTNGGQYYYTLKNGDSIQTELYGDTDENGIVTFMLKDDGLYFTTAEIPLYIQLLNHIDFKDLIVIDENRNLYCYGEDNSEGAIQLGFIDGKLRYMVIESENGDSVTYFYGYDKTEVPERPMDKFVAGVLLDENGNPV